MRRNSAFVFVVICSLMVVLSLVLRPSKAQDAAAPGVASPTQIIDQMMTLIGQNKVDDATAMMDGLKNEPDGRNAARDTLIHLRDQQGTYRGYDIAATQRFTPQFETVDVMSYYDLQPVLLRFHFYRPQSTGTWNVLGFQITTATREIAEILHDTPVDYVARKVVK